MKFFEKRTGTVTAIKNSALYPDLHVLYIALDGEGEEYATLESEKKMNELGVEIGSQVAVSFLGFVSLHEGSEDEAVSNEATFFLSLLYRGYINLIQKVLRRKHQEAEEPHYSQEPASD